MVRALFWHETTWEKVRWRTQPSYSLSFFLLCTRSPFLFLLHSFGPLEQAPWNSLSQFLTTFFKSSVKSLYFVFLYLVYFQCLGSMQQVLSPLLSSANDSKMPLLMNFAFYYVLYLGDFKYQYFVNSILMLRKCLN